MMHSQNDEERVIEEFFRDKPQGWFLDVGAYDGVTLSNTRALALKGWSGVLIEPSPFAFIKLVELYGHEHRFILVNAALALESRLTPLHCSPQAPLSTIEERAYKIHGQETSFTSFLVHTLPLEGFFLGMGEGFPDFLSVDTEGTSPPLALAILEYCQPQLVCVEHEGTPEWLQDALPGYETIHLTTENLLLTRNES
jgi:FkbM family methyltransferase